MDTPLDRDLPCEGLGLGKTHIFENITLSQTSFAGSSKMIGYKSRILKTRMHASSMRTGHSSGRQ